MSFDHETRPLFSQVFLEETQLPALSLSPQSSRSFFSDGSSRDGFFAIPPAVPQRGVFRSVDLAARYRLHGRLEVAVPGYALQFQPRSLILSFPLISLRAILWKTGLSVPR